MEDTRYYTLSELSEKFQVSRQTIRELISSGKLKAVRFSPYKQRISEEDLENYLKERSTK